MPTTASFQHTTGNRRSSLLDLAEAGGPAWALNTNYYKIELPIATTSIASGIANFTTRSNLADEVTQLYAGDLQATCGSSTSRTNCPPTGRSPSCRNSSTARRRSRCTSPRTAPAICSRSRCRRSSPTGRTDHDRRLRHRQVPETSDNSGPFRTQTVYALLDNNTATADSSSPTATIAGRGRLQTATANAATAMITSSAFVWGRPTSDSDTTKRSGWY